MLLPNDSAESRVVSQPTSHARSSYTEFECNRISCTYIHKQDRILNIFKVSLPTIVKGGLTPHFHRFWERFQDFDKLTVAIITAACMFVANIMLYCFCTSTYYFQFIPHSIFTYIHSPIYPQWWILLHISPLIFTTYIHHWFTMATDQVCR